jgi:hypothetical protein
MKTRALPLQRYAVILMSADHGPNYRSRTLRPLADFGGRAAAVTLRPFTGAVGAAAGAGISQGRHVVDRFLESGELERLLASARVQAIFAQVVRSDGATQLIDTFFESGLFDTLVDRLLASDGLWRLIDEIASSPAVRAALSQQGLGFADQVGAAVRARSRRADRRLERAAERLRHGRPPESGPIPMQADEHGQPVDSSASR